MVIQDNIRNFAIVAHIDHGKSTLADRLLEATGTIEKRQMIAQILDSNPIERERGITIKLAPVRMRYRPHPNPLLEGEGDKEYILNLIDTPGHVDFSYEVSRSLAACEGVLLVVDATQGVQAQTVAHMQLITDRNLKVIPVINKIDLPTARISEVAQSLEEMFGFAQEEIVQVSAKLGTHIDTLLKAIVERIPPPSVDINVPLRGLVFSSQYDTHRGVIAYIRIVEGRISLAKMSPPPGSPSGHPVGDLTLFATKASFKPIELGIFTPSMRSVDELIAGEVGYIATGLKDLSLARVGDTICSHATVHGSKTVEPLPGYKEPKQMVYLSLFPVDNDDYLILRESLEKLHLSDSSFTFKPHSSPALGKGFTCGFLGLLHGEVVKERLEKEFALSLITTAPTVEYEVNKSDGTNILIHTPEDFPNPSHIREILEPVMYTTIYTPKGSVGAVMQLAQDKRAEFINLEYIGKQGKFTYIIPLAEMIFDFFDKLKSISSGYASLDYELYEMRRVDAVKLDILINRSPVDAFSQIVVKEKVQSVANYLVEKLRDLIPRHQFQIPIQATIGGKIIARSDVKSFRKDVTKKLYGGDQTRKDKLLEAQKKGKKRMRQFGNVNIPQEVFLQVYK